MFNRIAQQIKATAAAATDQLLAEADKFMALYNLGSTEEPARDYRSLVEEVSRTIHPTNTNPIKTVRTLRRLGHTLGLASMQKIHPNATELAAGITFLEGLMAQLPQGRLQALLSREVSKLFEAQFEMTGDLLDLEHSIVYARNSIQHIAESDSHFHLNLYHLISLLDWRVSVTNDMADAPELVHLARKLFSVTDRSIRNWPAYGCALGTSLSLLARAEKREDYLHEAIPILRDVVRFCTATQHIFTVHVTGRLGETLLVLFEISGKENIGAIEEAISTRRLSLSIAQQGSREFPPALRGLAKALCSRYQYCTRNPADLDEAISLQEQAIALVPEASMDAVVWSFDLIAYALWLKGESIDEARLRSLMVMCKRTATSPLLHPALRHAIARMWAETLYRFGDDPVQCIEAFDTAINLQSVATGLETSLSARHSKSIMFIGFSATALTAAAAAFRATRIEKALEWLEQGRTVLWSQLNHLRSPLASLADVDPALAQRIADIAPLLETGTFRDDIPAGLGADSDFHLPFLMEKASVEYDGIEQRKLVRAWESALTEVRSQPGFERFLLPKQAMEIMSGLPEGGYVVVVNVDVKRCDALVLSSAKRTPIHVPLPQFSHETAAKLRDRLKKGLIDAEARKRREIVLYEGNNAIQSDDEPIDEVFGVEDELRTLRPTRKAKGTRKGGPVTGTLKALWEMIVKPIIEELRLLPSEDADSLPRIWWCPTGPLTSLPLHAAGIYTNGAIGPNISDYAISSPLPPQTLADPPKFNLGVLAQPDAAGLTSLPGTMQELQKILERISDAGDAAIEPISGDEATMEACLNIMEHCSSIHLACHAIQTPNAPLKSGFFLHDGKLELLTIIQRKFGKKEFAFLSACQTSMGDEQLPDELVHLAAGMLTAGYRSVVGTMWSIRDQYAVGVADQFYKTLLSKRGASGSKFGRIPAAYALHTATRELRQKVGTTETGLVAWVPYIHLGY
ncbi:CHAT domain-containing protein [Coprinopsis sp. MPI-PUGE-AT-0042]|nr:CHAT domain-containing protein [Coprinopsis sp. MPI-PUGE-AT-0042]